MKNLDAAKEALSDMPPRLEEELDPVTLHNQVSKLGEKADWEACNVLIVLMAMNHLDTYLPTYLFTGFDSYG